MRTNATLPRLSHVVRRLEERDLVEVVAEKWPPASFNRPELRLVFERLLDEESAALGELEVLVGKPIRLQTESLYEPDQYDVVLM